jgi:hypothetical protein
VQVRTAATLLTQKTYTKSSSTNFFLLASVAAVTAFAAVNSNENYQLTNFKTAFAEEKPAETETPSE